MKMPVCVGFGVAFVTKDGTTIYDGELDWEGGNEPKTVADIEELAKADPEHDWQIIKHGPLHGETFQRQGDERWVCIESNRGFA